MSRIGKLPVPVPANINVEVSDLNVKVQGPKGSLQKTFAGDIVIEYSNGMIAVKPTADTRQAKAMWGTARNIINSLVVGVTTGFKTELEINGVGYRAVVKGNFLNLTLGKSHNTKVQIPDNIKIEVIKQNLISLECADKESLGQFVALVKRQRKTEPYKGKGIKIVGEYVERKEGKKG